MLRVTGRCLLLLLIIASCGSLIVNSGFKPNDPAPDLVDIVEIPLLKLHPVPLSDIRKQISHTKNYYDFFRIFLSKKEVSNEEIDDLVNARTIQKILKAREYDYSEEMPMDAEQERLDEELTEALYHQYEMESSPLGKCKTPQPEIVTVIDHENKNRIYLPECTVVYRCRNVTGCCGSAALECGPLKIQVIERSFIVMNLFNDEQALPGKDMVEKRVFINHTECGCREKQSLPDCDKKKCPYPFTMMRKGVECTCDCHQSANENNYLCQGIKDGVIPLMETDLACIKSTKCLHPVCTKGDLHIQSGHCPSIPVDEIRYPETRLAKEKDRHMRHYKQKQIHVKERELEVESDVKSDFETDIETEIGTGSGTNVEPKLVTEIETRVRSQLLSKIETEVVHQPEVEAEVESHVDSKEKSNVEIEVETEVKPRMETELETQMKPIVETFVEKRVGAQIDPEAKSDNETASVTRKNTVTKKDTVTMTTLAQPDVNANTAAYAKTAVNTGENTNPEVTTEMHANRRRWKNKNRNKWKKQKDSVLKKTEIQS